MSAVFCCGHQIATPPSFQPQPAAIYSIQGRCEEELPHHNYIISAAHQKFYLSSFYTDTTSYIPGDSLYFHCRILPFSQRSNPGEFNYARYLQQKEVRFRLLPVSPLQKHGSSRNLFYSFTRLRQRLLNKTSALITDSSSCQIINALCLGFKNDLDKNLQNLFISTGTIHLLSVSGLHTGAIYLLLLFLLQATGLKKRSRELLVLPFLWAYACLTGLSPSVVRASTILTFITLGKILYLDYTPLNAVAASAFFTLLFRPYSLYSLSFLMSYSAYTGILLLYPVLYRLPGKLPWYLSKIYACCCLTLSAQLPTLPISAFYFHTINLNGFLTNLLAVPLTTLLLYVSAAFLFLPQLFSVCLAPLIQWLCKQLLSLLHFFQPLMLNIGNLYPAFWLILFIYLCFILFLLYLFQRKIYWLKTSCYALTLLFCCLSLHNLTLSSRQEILIFHLYRHTGILLNYKGHYTFLKQSTPDMQKIKPYLLHNKLRPLSTTSGVTSPLLWWKSSGIYTPTDTIVIASSGGLSDPVCHTLIITDNLYPEKIFSPLCRKYPGRIITDGSNSFSTLRRWDSFCRLHHIPLYHTSECGSIRLSLNKPK